MRRQVLFTRWMSPNRPTAFARASSGSSPRAMYSRVRISTWKANSASTSSETLALKSIERSCRPKAPWRGMIGDPDRCERSGASGGEQDARHRAGKPRPLLGLGAELLLPHGGEPIELGLSPELGLPPLGFDPPAALHAVEGRVE